jgi:hypothetical protein
MEERERSYRGISARAAVGYLEGLGGDRVEARVLEGEDWRASLTEDTVGVGPSLELTEVTVQFEGEPAVLDGLIEDFSRKAMRAGG